MLDREWVSISDPDESHDRYLFDISFLLSSYECIYGRGCPGTDGRPDVACCGHGAYFVDDEDRAKVEALVPELGPARMANYGVALRRGITAKTADGSLRTRVVNGACIFSNPAGWPTGMGCALHHLALERGVHHLELKPDVCWIVPLRREVTETVADDGEPLWTTTITSFDRGAWGPGGSAFSWWCTTDGDLAYGGDEPVYRSMAAELTALSSPAVYAELAAYLDRRVAKRRKPLRLLPVLATG